MSFKFFTIPNTLLIVCLVASIIFQHTIIVMLLNVLYAVVWFYIFYNFRKNQLTAKDKYFLISLGGAILQEFFTPWREQFWAVLFAIGFLFVMFFFLIMAIQQESQFILLNKKANNLRASLIILVSILYYVILYPKFLPTDLMFPLFIHVFVMFFAILVAVNRTTNRNSYCCVIGGLMCYTITTILASVSLFIQEFAWDYPLERFSFMLGLSLVSRGMLLSYANAKVDENSYFMYKPDRILYTFENE